MEISQRRLKESDAEWINQLQKVAVAATSANVDRVYRESMSALHHVLGAEIGSLQLLDDESRQLHFVATIRPRELSKLQKRDPIDVDKGTISGSVVRTGRPLLFKDSWKDPKFGARQKSFAQELRSGNRSYICVPLVARKRILGVLNVLHHLPSKFTEKDLNLAVSLASFIGMAVDQVRFVERLRQVAETVSSIELERVYDESMKALRHILGAEIGSLQLSDNEGQQLRFVATIRPEELAELQKRDPISVDEGTISGSVVRTGRPLLFKDSWKDPKFGVRQESIAQELRTGNRSYICVPLKARERILGVLNVLHNEPNKFSEEDLGVCIILASTIAIAVQNAGQFKELADTTEKFTRVQRLASMADIVSNFTHTINNNVGYISAQVDFLEELHEEGTLNDDQLWRELADIKGAAMDTIAKIRELKRPFAQIKTELVNVQECIKEAIQELQVSPEELCIVVNLATDIPRVYATRQLTDVFANLFRNARDAMQEHGSPEKKVYITSSQVLAGKLGIIVTDTGPGVSLEVRDKLFRLGVSTKPKELGGGYGLWWSKTWLQRIGGDIQYDQSKTGTRFAIELPIRSQFELLSSVATDTEEVVE